MRGETPTVTGMLMAIPMGAAEVAAGRIVGTLVGRALAGLARSQAAAEADTAVRQLTQDELQQVVGGVPSQFGKVLQSGGNAIEQRTAKSLNDAFGTSYQPREWGRAVESLKEQFGLPPSFHGKITSDGSYLDKTGSYLGNLWDYIQ
jgi:hypothetical protein